MAEIIAIFDLWPTLASLLLPIFGYAILAGICGALWEERDEGSAVFYAMLWPICLPYWLGSTATALLRRWRASARPDEGKGVPRAVVVAARARMDRCGPRSDSKASE